MADVTDEPRGKRGADGADRTAEDRAARRARRMATTGEQGATTENASARRSPEERAERRARREARAREQSATADPAARAKRSPEERAERRARRQQSESEGGAKGLPGGGAHAEPQASAQADASPESEAAARTKSHPPRSAEEQAARRARREARAAGDKDGVRAAGQALRALRGKTKAPKSKRSGEPLVRLEIERLYQDEDFAVSRMGDADAPRVVLCFAGIGGGHDEGEGGFRMSLGGLQPAEFVGSSRIENSSVLHIADIRRTWFNGFDPERLMAVLRPLVEGKQLFSLGNSMGGFGAIWITKYLPIDVAMAFVPQFSVHPDIVPDETRWAKWTRRITDYRVKSLADSFVEGTRYYTFNSERDELHWTHFRPAPDVHHYVVEGADHDAAKLIKEAGVLSEVIRTCVSRGDPRAALEAGGLTVRTIGE